MICMIDDREDVWNFAPGLVAVKPYTYFKNQTPSDSHFWMNTGTVAIHYTLAESTTIEIHSKSEMHFQLRSLKHYDHFLSWLKKKKKMRQAKMARTTMTTCCTWKRSWNGSMQNITVVMRPTCGRRSPNRQMSPRLFQSSGVKRWREPQ